MILSRVEALLSPAWILSEVPRLLRPASSGPFLYNLFVNLNFILVCLDRELERLGRLRAIVAGLASPSSMSEAAPPAPLPAVTLAPALPVVAEPVPVEAVPRRAYRRQVPTVPSLKPRPMLELAQPRALTGNIPTGPVVVSAAMVQKLSTPVASEPATELNPDALLRELSARWATGLATSAH